MRRPVFTSLSLLSLLLLFSAVAMDVRSYKVRDVWDRRNDGAGMAVYSNRGAVICVRVRHPPEPSVQYVTGGVRTSRVQFEYPMERPRVWSAPGIAWRERRLATDLGRPQEFNFAFHRMIVVRYWLVCVAAALLPAWWFVQYLRVGRRTARARRGLCPNCGYDLRASPQRCPECGTPAPEATGTGAAGTALPQAS